MENQKHVHLDFMNGTNESCATKERGGTRQEEHYEFDLKEFMPEIFDCEADGSCSNGHQHVNIKL